MSLLPRETALGHLQLLEVYDYYDGPRLFAARNVVGTTFFVLWADDLQDQEVWLYVPVSEERLLQLREGSLSIREAFLKAEDGILHKVVQPKGAGDVRAEVLRSADLALEWLPPEGDRIQLALDRDAKEHIGVIEGPEAEEVDWIRRRTKQQVTIARAHGRLPPNLSTVTNVLAHWRRLFEETVKQVGSSVEMLPVRATPGSFKVELAIDDPAAASAAFRTLVDLFNKKPRDASLENLIASGRVPAVSYRNLLSAIANGEVEVRVSMTGVHAELEIHVGPELAKALRVLVAKATRGRIQSDQIPQADDLHRVFRVLELTSRGTDITAERLDVVHRQVNYYKHAARVLGYLDDDNELTAAGIQAMRLGSEERFVSCAVQFENSDCGAAWIMWSKGSSLAAVALESAEEFLATMSDLAPSTASRRAQTLRSWLATVLPYHYARWFKSDAE